MVPGFHTQKIVEEIFRLSENTSKSAPSSDNTRFDWLEKYINSDAGMECLPKYYTVLQGCRKRRGGGIWGGFSPSPVFGRTVNPISTRGADYAHPLALPYLKNSRDYGSLLWIGYKITNTQICSLDVVRNK